ncbi:FAD-dependent oxidoreductase [Pseudoroseomonas deserti]|uniref:FAD-dependent oxidoreductase n=1 Tax=Teichococcus deserti TaxID=1817963 RepID=A0A1V2GXV5_9PROT|nr:FAD-dependent oxidoreductase [Pseudoroseomonas deserti]ONG49974.1 FAD-dependent oxidoreductase [Pseudoroseomonas deserti]
MQRPLFDALVLGAGMAGASAAAHLAPRRRVALLEAEERPGLHSTGRSAALWEPNWGNPDSRALTRASHGFLTAPPPGFSEVPLTAPRRALHLAPPDQVAELEAAIAKTPDFQAISPEDARKIVPALRPGYAAAAALERVVLDIDVASLHQGFLRMAKAAGAVVLPSQRAARIERRGGLWHVQTETGENFAAPILVNAAGAWGDVVTAMAGLPRLGLQPKRRSALIVDPAPWPVAAWPLVGDIGASWYARPEAATRLMLSPADETDCDPGDAQPDELDIAIAVDRLIQAMDIAIRRVEHRWAGLRSFLPDRSMAIGPGGAPGFFQMIGQGGYGIQTAPAQGRLLAALIDETDPGELAAVIPLVDPRRFLTVPA